MPTTQQHSPLFRYEAQGKNSHGFVLASAIVYALRAPDGKKSRIHLINQDVLIVMDDVTVIVDKLEKALIPGFIPVPGADRVSPLVSFTQMGNEYPGYVVGLMMTHLSLAPDGRRSRIHLVNREVLQTTDDLSMLMRRFDKSLQLTGGRIRLTELDFKPNDKHHSRDFA